MAVEQTMVYLHMRLVSGQTFIKYHFPAARSVRTLKASLQKYLKTGQGFVSDILSSSQGEPLDETKSLAFHGVSDPNRTHQLHMVIVAELSPLYLKDPKLCEFLYLFTHSAKKAWTAYEMVDAPPEALSVVEEIQSVAVEGAPIPLVIGRAPRDPRDAFELQESVKALTCLDWLPMDKLTSEPLERFLVHGNRREEDPRMAPLKIMIEKLVKLFRLEVRHASLGTRSMTEILGGYTEDKKHLVGCLSFQEWPFTASPFAF